ncbi:MAG: hypothetical protein A2729_01420 [Candidatus Buchananbacteria bacterium RIFCSPHIGHO2_01_FULL_39_14]|uniref:Ribbon-helix-helix protein CopG domain-containing protein n=1 Tax=Candidatus Buchananbacteria bacterium RIFCSPHIGHO2_01_FULL_39_14 TaxID=1797532 RepID=A0A1G1XTX4_9BACT|nr:MAG: hypothetical protein A2729_01420 [Candidatus Buchananbacteria bacterium RIFCSPHIGHO2_01_FULL_39_14]
MTTATLRIPDDLTLEVNNIVQDFGFQNKEEFVQEAIRDKVLELRKLRFFSITDKVAANLKKKNISEREILKHFETVRSK